MPINEFYQSPRFTPLDPEMMFKIKTHQDEQQKEALNLLDPSKFVVKGGYATKNLAKEYNDEVINPLLQKYTDKIAKGEPMANWYRNYVGDVSKIKTDPIYNTIKEDEGYIPTVQAQMKDPSHPYSLQDYYNPNTGFTQLTRQDIYSGKTLPGHYTLDKPVSVTEDNKDIYAMIKPALEQHWGTPVQSFSYDPDGNPVAIINTTEGQKIQHLDRNMVKEILKPTVQKDFYGFVGSKASLRYNKRLREGTIPGYQYTPDEALTDLAEGFLGSFEYKEDLAPKVQQSALPKGWSGGGAGADKYKYSKLSDNPVDNALMNAQTSETGTASADLGTVGALLNANAVDKSKGTASIVLGDTPTLLHVGTSNNTPEEQDQNIKLGVYGRLKDIKNEVVSKSDPGFLGYNEAQANRLHQEMLDSYKQKYPVKDGYTVEMDFSNPAFGTRNFDGFTVYKKEGNQLTPVQKINPNEAAMAVVKKDPRYIKTRDEYKSKYGIDIEDPNFEKDILTMASSAGESQDIQADLSVGLSSYMGNVEFHPNSTNTITRGNDGNFYASGVAELPADKVKAMFKGDTSKMQKAVDLGILQPYSLDDKDVITSYTVPITRKITEDIGTASQRYWRRDGATEDEKKQEQGQVERSKNVTQRNLENLKFGRTQLMPQAEQNLDNFRLEFLGNIDKAQASAQEKETVKNQAIDILNQLQGSGLSHQQKAVLYGALAAIYREVMPTLPKLTKIGTSTTGAQSYQKSR